MTTKSNPNSATFLNWKIYSKNGKTDLTDILVNENFIIKGNNYILIIK